MQSDKIANTNFQSGRCLISYSVDYVIETKNRQMAETIYRVLMSWCKRLEKQFGFGRERK